MRLSSSEATHTQPQTEHAAHQTSRQSNIVPKKHLVKKTSRQENIASALTMDHMAGLLTLTLMDPALFAPADWASALTDLLIMANDPLDLPADMLALVCLDLTNLLEEGAGHTLADLAA